MNHFQLTRLLEEIAPRVIGGFVRKIYQPGKFVLQIGIYAGGVTHRLTVRTAPGLGCCYLTAEKAAPTGDETAIFTSSCAARLKGSV